MPIQRKRFETGNFKNPRLNNDRTNHPVAVLLRKNQNLAYTVKEICKRTKMKSETVRGMLRILIKKDKMVVHKSPYFAWKVKKRKTTKKKR